MEPYAFQNKRRLPSAKNASHNSFGNTDIIFFKEYSGITFLQLGELVPSSYTWMGVRPISLVQFYRSFLLTNCGFTTGELTFFIR